MEEFFVRHDGRMEYIRTEVGMVGVDCVGFWAHHCYSVVLGPANKDGGWKGRE